MQPPPWGFLRVAGAQLPLSANPTIIGRDRAKCNVFLADASVSGVHARIWLNGGRAFVENYSQTNPTRVRGHTIGAPMELRVGDVIEFGNVRAEFLLVQAGPPVLAPAAPVLAPAAAVAAPAVLPNTQGISSAAKLVIQLPGQPASEFPLIKSIVTLGRALDNDKPIPNPFVSEHHARLESIGAGFRIVDLKSRNGVLVNGVRVQAQDLRHNDVIRIGDAYGNSVTLTYVQAGALPAAGMMPLKLVHPTTTLGRDPQSNVQLNAPTVSRAHARIDYDGAGYTITDLNSRNGTFVNGARIRRQRLNLNDVVQIGPFQLRYDRGGFSQQVANGNVRIDALHLKRQVVVKGVPHFILNDVSLSIQPKDFVALVGSSGAGKSTLMNALSGFTRAEGAVLLNGADLYRDFEAYRAMLGYVPQADIIHRGLPVMSALRYAAQLRLPADWATPQIDQRVEEVMRLLEIDQQRANMVNRLSGGQLKRVSIAAELLSEPALFFLDEPTSGLDPGLEKKMMYKLRELADRGQTIVLVTHATANIDQCSKIAFMCGGRLVFYGTPSEAKTFFGQQDFSDIYTELSQVPNPQDPDQVPRQWEGQFKGSNCYQQYVVQPLQHVQPAPAAAPPLARTQGARVSPFRQWWILTRRYLELIVRDKMTLGVLLAVMPLIAMLVLVIAEPLSLVGQSPEEIEKLTDYAKFGDAQKLLFIISLAAVLLGIFASAYEIVREQAIYKRERMVSLGILPYVFSKIGVLFTFSLFQAFVFLLILRLRVDFPASGALWGAPLEMYVTLVLATLASITLGLLLSALAKNENMVIYVILVLLFIQIIFAGAIFDLPAGAKPFQWFTITHWTMDALGSTIDMRHLETLEKMNGVHFTLKEWSINYGRTAKHLLSRWAILAGVSVLFTAATCLIQKTKDNL